MSSTATEPNRALKRMEEVLRRIDFGAEIVYFGQLCDNWSMDTSGSGCVSFHVVCYGTCWLHTPTLAEPIQLVPGDIVVFPYDTRHVIGSSKNEKPRYGEIVVSNQGPMREHEDGTGLICGHFKLPEHARTLVFTACPPFLLLGQGTDRGGERMRMLIELLLSEIRCAEFGMRALVERLTDALFIYVLRHAVRENPRISGLLAALSDSDLQPATRALMENPATAWTVGALAKHACLSRSAFAKRFVERAGMPPMEFVTRWRMQLALGWLKHEGASVLDVAARCGYDSEASFRKAFKRIVGTSPGQVRRGGKAATATRAPQGR